MGEIREALGISFREVAKAIACPTHSFSVYDLQGSDDGDVFERLTPNRLSGSAEEIVIHSLTMKCLRKIAVRNCMKESVMRKIKNQATKQLRDRCLDSLA